jgi:RHS repeat-associated protein
MLTYKPDDSSDAVAYTYRADGMRTKKVDDYASPSETTDYFYDGQMAVQDVHDDGTDTTVTKYGIGARGIDVITRKVNSGSETFGYPLYDTHGNMVATLARAPTNDFTTGNAKSYDVWGGDRSGSSSVYQGYVANLGHRSDAESDLQYMRARYYEPGTGRFISQDRGRQGSNWFIYAGACPTSCIDPDGKWFVTPVMAGWLIAVTTFCSALGGYLAGFFMAIEVIQSFQPNFNPGMDWISMFLPLGGALMINAASPNPNIGGGMKFWAFANKYLAKSNGWAFAFGLLCGGYAARVAYELYYAEHYDELNGSI